MFRRSDWTGKARVDEDEDFFTLVASGAASRVLSEGRKFEHLAVLEGPAVSCQSSSFEEDCQVSTSTAELPLRSSPALTAPWRP